MQPLYLMFDDPSKKDITGNLEQKNPSYQLKLLLRILEITYFSMGRTCGPEME